MTVTVHTAKPGIVIGKGGANVELLRNSIGKLTDKKVKLEIKEVLQPELDAVLVAQTIAGQLERRIAFRKAVKQGVQRSIKAGAKGVRSRSRAGWAAPRCPAASGTRKVAFRSARFAPTSATAWSTPTPPTGRIGVKVWIYRGETLADRPARPGRSRASAPARHAPVEPRRSTTAAAQAAPAAAEEGGAVAVAEPEPIAEPVTKATAAPRSRAAADEQPAAAAEPTRG